MFLSGCVQRYDATRVFGIAFRTHVLRAQPTDSVGG